MVLLLYLPPGHWLHAEALLAEYLPASQSEQDVPATAVVDCPASHELQKELPSDVEYLPIAQPLHSLLPSVASPARQSVHDVPPAAALDLPLVHVAQVVDPAAELNLPRSQLAHEAKSEDEILPALHAMHELSLVAPDVVENLPLGQLGHSRAYLGAYLPWLHVVQSDPEAPPTLLPALPAGHCESASHFVPPTALVDLPLGQLRQKSEPELVLYLPIAHPVHLALPLFLAYLPAGQFGHEPTEAMLTELYFPVGQL